MKISLILILALLSGILGCSRQSSTDDDEIQIAEVALRKFLAEKTWADGHNILYVNWEKGDSNRLIAKISSDNKKLTLKPGNKTEFRNGRVWEKDTAIPCELLTITVSRDNDQGANAAMLWAATSTSAHGFTYVLKKHDGSWEITKRKPGFTV